MAKDKFSKKDLEYLEFLKKISEDSAKSWQKFNKELDKSQQGVEKIANAILGISFNDIYEEVGKTKEEMEMFSEAIKVAEKDLAGFAESISKKVSKKLDGLKGKDFAKSIKKSLGEIDNIDLSNALKSIEKSKNKTGDFLNLMLKFQGAGEDMDKVFKNFGFSPKTIKSFENNLDNIQKSKVAIDELKKSAGETENVISLSKAFSSIADNLERDYLGFERMWKLLGDFDNKVSDLQKNLGTTFKTFDPAKTAMTDLISKGAQFGVTMEDAFKNVTELGNILRTTNVAELAKMSEATQDISGALGVSAEDVNAMTAQFVIFGKSAGDVRKISEKTAALSARFGVSSKLSMEAITRNFRMFKEMGFKGGEDSLAKMAVKAQSLRIDIGDIFKSAEKLRTLEGAIDAAASLQLLGGTFAKFGPMEILAAARGDAEKLQDIISGVADDIGTFNEKGEFEISPIDKDRLSAAAEAIGMDYSKMLDMVTAKAQKTRKLEMLGDNFLNIGSEADKDFLASLTTIENGKVQLTVQGANDLGIKDLKDLTPKMIASQREATETAAKDLKKRNEHIQSLSQTFDNFINQIMYSLTVFQPLLKMLAEGIVLFSRGIAWFSRGIDMLLPAGASWVKGILAAALVMSLTFGVKFWANWKGVISGFGGIVKKLATQGVSGLFSKTPPTSPAGPMDVPSGAKGKTAPTILQQLKGISPAQILSVAAAMIALGAAFMLIGKGIQFASEGFAVLVKSFDETKNAGMALGAISVVMGGFVLMLALMIPLIGALGAVSGGAALPLLAVGAAFLMMGGSIALILIGISKVVDSFSKMDKTITAISNGISVVMKTMGDIAVNVINTIANSILKLSEINPLTIFSLAASLGALSLSIAAFAVSGTIGLLGLASMGVTLGVLSTVVSKLAPNLDIAAKSITMLVDGIDKLKATIKDLDLDKLKELKDISASFYKAGDSPMSQVSSKYATTPTMSKQRIEIDLKLNGRKLQEAINYDIKYLT